MPLLNLELQNIGPFQKINFDFDEQVNLFVGPNNCGKSTVLWALADIAVCPFCFPAKLLGEKQNRFSVGYRGATSDGAVLQGELPISEERDGETYWGFIQLVSQIEYSCFIPALRRGTDFRSKGAIAGGAKLERMRPPRMWSRVGTHFLRA